MERFLKSRYRIGDKISENPFSVTYQGAFLGTDKPIIVKIYKRGTLNSSLIKNMKQKVKDLSFVNHHGVAKLIDGDYGWQGFYYVREFVPGKSLRELLEAGEKIGIEKTLVVAEEICRALEFVHKKGIIHGALKPNNIFINKKGMVKIADFVIEGGIKEAFQQKALTVLEDGSYMSPEELLGRPATFASDIYSLGLVLFEMLAEQDVSQIFSNLRKMKQPSVLSHELLATLPRYLQDIVGKALQQDPLLRFSSAAEFRESLEKKNVILKPKPQADYVKIFEQTVTQYGGRDIAIGSEALQDIGRVRIRWSKEKHRNLILMAILALAVLSGVLYAFFMGK